MPDGKALQMGTSHNLGQNFAKGFGIKFLGKDEKENTPWQNSWGISTRMIGALIMVHSDDKGLVLPPRVASTQAVIVPIFKKENKEEIIKKANDIKNKMKSFSVAVDDRGGYSPGWKYNEWELKGIPLRIEIGPRDMEKGQVVIVRRDTSEKEFVREDQIEKKTRELLDKMQDDLFIKAKKFLEGNIIEVKDWKAFVNGTKERKMVKAFFCGDSKCEENIKEKTNGVTSRVIPFDQPSDLGKCVHCNKEAKHLVYFAKAY